MDKSFQTIKKKALPIFKSHAVKKAAVFGSVATGNINRRSDVDFIVEFRGRKSLLDLVGLKLELEDRLAKRVDVITYKSLHPLLAERILAEQKIIL